MRKIVFVSFILFILASSIYAGEFYNCIDRDGNTILTNSPQDGMKKCVLKESYKDPTPQERAREQSQEAETRQKQQINEAQEEARKQQTNRAQEKAGRRASHGTGCEIITFAQYERNSGGGVVVGGVVTGGFVTGGTVVGNKDTCVDLTIRNNDDVERNLTNTGIVAVTKKGNSRSPKGFMAKIKPGGIYQGTACFGHYLSTISKLECKF